jgi:hypothetical protein
MTDPLIAAAQFLVTQLPWLAHATDEQGGPYAASVFAEIRDCASRMRAVVEGPADRRYLGPCGAEREHDPLCVDQSGHPHDNECECWCHDGEPGACEGDVYARDGAPAGHCRTCGATVDTDQRRAWLDAEVRSRAFRAAEIAGAYGINVKTIRSWATERQARYDHSGTQVEAARPAKLHVHGFDRDGRPLFLVGDVLDLAAVDAARREQARAERARRAAARTEGAAA